MKLTTRIAKAARSLGLDAVVDNPKFRETVGAELYTKHRSSSPGEKAKAVVNDSSVRVQHEAIKKPVPKVKVGPLVSVIVPVYNVELYLEEAVLSILNQDYRNIEVILVDDGSTDSSPVICENLKAMDNRVVVIHKKNAGLGAARNTGIEKAKGKYLTFVDSDDLVTEKGITLMVKSLENSGSFFVAGSIERFNSTRAWIPAWVHQVHFEDKQGITAADLPPVLYDVFACNKLFRADKWNDLVGKFPEGVLYEDQEATAKLYANGTKFDLLEDVVYKWRLRDDNSSITQNKANLYDLQQRVQVAKSVEKVIATAPELSLREYWYTKLLSEDLYYYYREEPRTEIEFGETLQAAVKHFFPSATKEAIQSMPFDRRLMTLALAKGSIVDFRRVLLHFQEYGPYWEDSIDEVGNLVATSEIEEELSFGLEAEERIQDPSLITLQLSVFDQSVTSDGKVALDVWAKLNNLPRIDASGIELEVFVEDAEDKTQINAEYEIVSRYEVAQFGSNSFVDQSNSVLRIELNPEDIAEQVDNAASKKFMIKCQALSNAFAVTNLEVGMVDWLSLPTLECGEVSESGRRLVFGKLSQGVSVELEEVRFVIAEASFEQSSLKIEIKQCKTDSHWSRSIDRHGLRIQADSAGSVFAEGELHWENGNWVAEVSLPQRGGSITDNVSSFNLNVVSQDMYISRLAMQNRVGQLYEKPFFGLVKSNWGYASLEKFAQFGIVESYSFSREENCLQIQGRAFFDMGLVRQSTPSFALVNSVEGNIYPSSVSHDGNTGDFSATFHLERIDARGKRVALPSCSYIFQFLQPTGRKLPASIWPRITAPELLKSAKYYGELSRVIISPTPQARGLNVKIASPLGIESQGKLNQRRAQKEFVTDVDRHLNDAVLFESFGGASVTDSCLTLDKEFALKRPEIKRFWTVKDRSVAVPEGAIPLVQYSREWWKALGTSKFLVNNNNFPSAFRKAKGQHYFQVWHGTPLKRIGNDVPSANLSLVYRELMVREARYWDHFLAQSPWAGSTMKKAFGYQGPVIDIGYPRNVTLFGDAAEEARRLTRAYFGIEDKQKVILYAPTWRDSEKTASGAYEKVTYLDLKALHRKYGTNIIVLVRGHVNTNRSNTVLSGPNVIDVSKYPNLNDLINASDLLVGDYSSIMFDYVNTGKPILFLVPDIDEYRDVTRGFYFDFESIAPGPLCRNTSEITDALDKLYSIRRKYSEVYNSFRERFAPNDSERTGAEVFDLVYGA